MRLLPIAFLVCLSACASSPNSDAIDARMASWHGAPADELIAILGDPIISEKGNMTWRFVVPHTLPTDDHQHSSHHRHAKHSKSISVISGVSNTDVVSPDGSAVASGNPFETTDAGFAGDGVHRVRPQYCMYLAYVENGTVSRLMTFDNHRNGCLFTEVPVRSTEKSS